MFRLGLSASTDTRLFPPTTFEEQEKEWSNKRMEKNWEHNKKGVYTFKKIPTIYMNEWDLREYKRLMCIETKNMTHLQLKSFHSLARDKYQVDESNRINDIKNSLDSIES